MAESLEVGQRENHYHIVETEELPNLLTVRTALPGKKEKDRMLLLKQDLFRVGCTDNSGWQKILWCFEGHLTCFRWRIQITHILITIVCKMKEAALTQTGWNPQKCVSGRGLLFSPRHWKSLWWWDSGRGGTYASARGVASAPGQTVQSLSLSLSPAKPLERAHADLPIIHSRYTGTPWQHTGRSLSQPSVQKGVQWAWLEDSTTSANCLAAFSHPVKASFLPRAFGNKRAHSMCGFQVV